MPGPGKLPIVLSPPSPALPLSPARTLFFSATTADLLLKGDEAQVNAEVDTALTGYDPPTHAEMNAAIAAGGGAITFTYTLTSDVDASPIPDTRVWVTSDAGGTTILASGRTDASGQVTFYLDPGTIYL